MNGLRIWIIAAGLSALTAGISQAGPIVVYTDAAKGSGGDILSRGFYITSYSADNLSTVTLYYNSFVSGQYTNSLTARLNTYNGSIVGSTQQAIFNIPGNLAETAVTFDFGGAAVPVGSTITFTQAFISGPGTLFYDTGTAGPSGVTQTDGTSLPLDSFRRGQVATTITALAAPDPSSIVLLGVGLSGLIFLRGVRG